MAPPKPAKFWDPPILVRQSNSSVSWLQLFFDFTFVLSLSGLSFQWARSFHESEYHSFPLGLRWTSFSRLFVLVGILFLLRVWRWEVFYQSVFGGDNDPFGRVFTMLMIFSVSNCYITMKEPNYMHDYKRGIDMFIAYQMQMRLFHFIKFGRALLYQTERIMSVFSMLTAVFGEGITLLVIYFLDNDIRMIVLFILPFVSVGWQYSLAQCGDFTIVRMSRNHIIERFGISVILLLGDAISILNNTTAQDNIDKRRDTAGYGSFLAGFTTLFIVWVYHDNSRRESQSMTGFISLVWHISHVLLVPCVLIQTGTVVTIFESWTKFGDSHTLDFSIRFSYCGSSGFILLALWCERSAVHMGPIIRHWRVAIGFLFALFTTLLSAIPLGPVFILLIVFLLFFINVILDMCLHRRRIAVGSMHEMLTVKEPLMQISPAEPEAPIQTQSNLEMKLRQAEHEILLARKALSDVYSINEKLEETMQAQREEISSMKAQIDSFALERAESLARLKILEDENARVVELERKASEQIEEMQRNMEVKTVEAGANSSSDEDAVLVSVEDTKLEPPPRESSMTVGTTTAI